MKKPKAVCEQMKVLFLDIDGVVNSVRSAIALGGYPWTADPKDIPLFDHVALAWIRKICLENNVKIILSSTWRLTMKFEDLAKAIDLPIVGVTPRKLGASRGQEIAMWLSRNKVDSYAIVDDDGDMLEEQKPFFIQTDPYEGLSYKNANDLTKLLSVANASKSSLEGG